MDEIYFKLWDQIYKDGRLSCNSNLLGVTVGEFYTLNKIEDTHAWGVNYFVNSGRIIFFNETPIEDFSKFVPIDKSEILDSFGRWFEKKYELPVKDVII